MFQFIQKWKEKLFRAQGTVQEVRITREFLVILDCFVRNPEKWYSGADVMKNTKLSSGTVYPLLIRMNRAGWIDRRKVANDRRVYKLAHNAGNPAKVMLTENTHIWQCSSQAKNGR